ncbi:GPW/gp25 family protein [Kribbella sp. CA-293567]|uniref:GPW/gp25 family protein n=1 Tax=Kribbella sp. CA-293567 TaxID=3002436 RepID=UPI0022DD00E7|nr:GPW/gp25 family protein [Kribbella sp. CA-293567]WBQ06499.1 GPW/gp25 family protein [Kribbella sp. CA-293567]
MTIDAVAGLRFPLDCAGLGAFALARGTDKLEQGMRLILLTYPGERVMRPDFGSRLRDYVFESATPATIIRLADEVQQAINACEPRVRVHQVEVVPDPSVDGLLHLLIRYRLSGTDEVREAVIDFATDRHPGAGEED